jgi:type III secretory pathway lipoprotein EscJ
LADIGPPTKKGENVSKQVMVSKAVKSVDQELADQLNIAEEALIKAVELFRGENGRKVPERPEIFLKRLRTAQELITTLYREELVRIRGPIKVVLKKRGKK